MKPPAAGLALLAAILLTLLFAQGCSTIGTPRPARRSGDMEQAKQEMRGVASWYGPGFHGNPTASGEPYDMHAFTAAHRSLPLGTWIEVHNLRNHLRVRVRVNDRGPFIRGRVVDLSHAGAEAIDMLGTGTDPVELRILELAPVEAARPGDVFTVQVGAFDNAANALVLRDRLDAEHGNAWVEIAGSIYRVQVGRFTDRDDAERMRTTLEREGLPGFVAVVR